jgi:hypothetical protein
MHFVSDSLAPNQVVVRNLRRDPDNPKQIEIQSPAVNIEFIGDDPQILVSSILCNVDVVSDLERDCISMTEAVRAVLQAAGYTPLIKYPSLALAGGNLYWDVNSIKFRPVRDELFYRYSCTLRLMYHDG